MSTQEQEPDPQHFFTGLKEDISGYVDARIKLMRLTLVNKVSKVMASLALYAFIAMIVFSAMLFAFIVLALYVTKLSGNILVGFGSVSVLLAIISWIVLKMQGTFEKPLINLLIKNIMEQEEENAGNKKEDEA